MEVGSKYIFCVYFYLLTNSGQKLLTESSGRGYPTQKQFGVRNVLFQFLHCLADPNLLICSHTRLQDFKQGEAGEVKLGCRSAKRTNGRQPKICDNDDDQGLVPNSVRAHIWVSDYKLFAVKYLR